MVLLESGKAMSESELDGEVEKRLLKEFNITVDFEIGDALAKLERFGMVKKSGEKYSAIPLVEAKKSLDRSWDNIFTHNA